MSGTRCYVSTGVCPHNIGVASAIGNGRDAGAESHGTLVLTEVPGRRNGTWTRLSKQRRERHGVINMMKINIYLEAVVREDSIKRQYLS